MLCLLLVCFLFPFIHRQFHAGSFQVGTAWRCQFTSRPRTFHSCLHMRLQFDPMASVTARIQPRNGVAKNTDKHGRRNRIHRPRVSQKNRKEPNGWRNKQQQQQQKEQQRKSIYSYWCMGPIIAHMNTMRFAYIFITKTIIYKSNKDVNILKFIMLTIFVWNFIHFPCERLNWISSVFLCVCCECL